MNRVFSEDSFIPPNDKQKPHRHCEKTLVRMLLIYKERQRGFSWQSPNVEIASNLLFIRLPFLPLLTLFSFVHLRH